MSGHEWTLDLVLPAAAVLTGLLAAGHVMIVELPLDQFGSVRPPDVPFTDAGAAAAAILVVAALAAGVVIGGTLVRRTSILVAGGIVAYAVPYEVYAWAVSVLWVALGGLALVVSRMDRDGRAAYTGADAGLVLAAAAVGVLIVAPPSRLAVSAAGVAPFDAVSSAVALLAVTAGFLLLSREGNRQPWGRGFGIAAGATVAYLVSVAVVDLVATRVGSGPTIDELRTQGQAALSVTWAVLGVIGYVAGLRFRNEDLRRGGLALLVLATTKVFVFDLSSLDVAYRVISLIVLGLLLLASAWLWQRLMPHPPASAGSRNS